MPRRENGRWTANPQIEYRGYIELAGRSGRLRDLMAESICENDTFSFDRATGEIATPGTFTRTVGPLTPSTPLRTSRTVVGPSLS